ncbi:lipocalin / cytosolic fatty-acid binding protein [Dictyocaulus viviparus]|uniref:Lipocalin / cytosolic fatty-acid binding protein n=1 Tax=Dictyocaulus viviparus TaxID=29172 RepID=A0A0D8YAB8_DICVI|nr:lipocalin / cytosolic fatty-acid binding protein [Dictyocaulus viviparus]
MPIEEDILGKWSFVSSENFEAYMKEAGVGLLTRKVAANIKPNLEFVREGDHIKMTSVSTFKTYVTKFKIGETFDEKTGDGREVTQTYTIENDRLVLMEKGKNGGAESRIERYIEDGKLNIVCECNGVKCTRIYERMKE